MYGINVISTESKGQLRKVNILYGTVQHRNPLFLLPSLFLSLSPSNGWKARHSRLNPHRRRRYRNHRCSQHPPQQPRLVQLYSTLPNSHPITPASVSPRRFVGRGDCCRSWSSDPTRLSGLLTVAQPRSGNFEISFGGDEISRRIADFDEFRSAFLRRFDSIGGYWSFWNIGDWMFRF